MSRCDERDNSLMKFNLWRTGMASGRVLYTDISSSRRFNKLFRLGECGRLAQLTYLLSYPHCDNWGHLPFNEEHLKYQVMPGYEGLLEDLLYSMCLLVYYKLWDTPYCVDENLYVHIFNFENKSHDAIRHRLCGKWPDESGQIPAREKLDTKKLVDIKTCLSTAEAVRKHSQTTVNMESHPQYSLIFKKIREYSESYTHELTLKPEKFATSYEKVGGLFSNISIDGITIKPSYLLKVYKHLNSDIEALGRVLFRSRNAKNIYAYINSGLSQGWLRHPTSEEEIDPEYCRKWIDNLFGIVDQPKSLKRGLYGIDAIINEEGFFDE